MDKEPQITRPQRARGWIIAGFGLLVIILFAAAAGSAWQEHVQQSNLDDVEAHSTTASLLQNAGEEAALSAPLLQRYVVEGDDTLIPEIQSHSSAAVDSLTGAAAQGSVTDIDEIAVDGLGLAESAGRVIALRQNGDAQGAAATMEEIAPAFEQFTIRLENATQQEFQEVAALQSSADRAGDRASWLLIVAVAAGATLGLAASALVVRSIIRRRVSKIASPI